VSGSEAQAVRLVMRGLDPRIHLERIFSKKMDRRVKPGDDERGRESWPHI
jgi:hypothetical protein